MFLETENEIKEVGGCNLRVLRRPSPVVGQVSPVVVAAEEVEIESLYLCDIEL